MSVSTSLFPAVTAALAAAGLLSPASAPAQLQTAGALFVNVDATVAPVGALTSLTNRGTLGGFFEARGGGTTIPRVAPAGSSSTRGIQFDGGDYLQLVAALGGPPVPAPAGLVGPDPTRSIEVWALNPTIDTEETLVSWGKRGGPAGSNLSFNYGSSGAFGAVGHWDTPDIGWNDAGGAPAANTWHHLVYTYDGTTTRVYSDGVLQNSEILGAGVINTATNTPISLATQTEPDGITPTAGLRGSLTLARVRIHDGVLSDQQVLNNYNVEKAEFAALTGAPLTSGPAHRYSFSESASANASGAAVLDSIGAAHGTVRGAGASATGARLVLAGGPSATAAYLDLPNGLLSGNSADSGGSGEVTFEGWVKINSSAANARIFDFGSTTGGELTGPGGGGPALDSFSLFAQTSAPTNRHVEVRNTDGAAGGTESVDYVSSSTNLHFAATWKESTGEIQIYENGIGVATLFTDERLSALHDVNNWLGRANDTAAPNTALELDEFRIYSRVLAREEVFGNFQIGPNVLNLAGPVAIYAQPENQTGVEGKPVTFSVGASGTPPIYYQWFRGASLIPGATDPRYTLTATFADQGATFSCVVSNFYGSLPRTATSSAAALTVAPDTFAPVLLQAAALGPNTVRVIFDEALLPASVIVTGNYQLTGPAGAVAISGAALDNTQTNVVLTAGPLTNGVTYTLTVSGVRDASQNQNLVAPGSSVTFRADTRPRFAEALLAHRYSFGEPASANAAGQTFFDSIGNSHGVVRGSSGATFTGSRLTLSGGSSASSPYADLPNGLLSSNSVDRGGSGGFTFEGWLKITGTRNWSRIFDFGSTTGGELNGPGGGGEGLDYFMVSAMIGTTATSRRSEVRNQDGASGGVNTLDYGTTTFGQDFHIVATWRESTGEINIWENAQLVGSYLTDERISSINDVNVWLGRSNWTADDNTQGEYDEVRLYDGVLTPGEVAAAYRLGPDRLAVPSPPMLLTQPASITATELRPATFSVTFEGQPTPTFQWTKNDLAIPEATNSSYTLPEALLSDNNARFRVTAANVVNGVVQSVASAEAVLTVQPDTQGPQLVAALGLSLDSLSVIDGVQVQFDEGVLPATATNVDNYTLTGPAGDVPLVRASMDPSLRFVSIAASATLLEGATYTLQVRNVRDRSVASNPIAPGSQVSFVAFPFALRNVGTATGTVIPVPGGYEIRAAGRDIGANGDDFGFYAQPRSGDFDVKVQVSSLELSDGYSSAGLMARDGFATNAAFAAVMASPSLGGVRFSWRANVGGNTASSGQIPVNFPYTWLRLRRAGDLFSGYGSFDGQVWQLLGSATIGMSAQVNLGFSVSSHNAGLAVGARFLEAANVSGGTIAGSLTRPFEPPGPASRHTALAITEIMYHPAEVPGVTNSLEYVEIFNSQDYLEDISGFRLAGDIDYTFPPGTILPSGGYVVVARDPAAIMSLYGIAGVLGPFTNDLPNTRGTVRLISELGARFLTVDYDSESPWPAAADGAGHSLVLARPSYGQNHPQAWAASEFIGGSPGRPEGYVADPQRAVVINEFLAHTDLPLLDYVELFNTSPQPVDLSGCWLSDDFGTNKFRIPDGTILPPRRWAAFTETQLGFSLSADGEEILLVNSNRTRVLDAVRYAGQANGVPTGRYPDGAPDFRALDGPTFATNNAAPLRRPIVISEIMYNPISGDEDDEYLELYNRAATNVNVGGWRFAAGINFVIPSGTTLAPGAYLVVAHNRTHLLARYPNLAANPALVVGDYGGRLDNGGERVALAMPDESFRTNGAVVVTNIFYIVVNEVSYETGGRWGRWSDGGGSSLELIDPQSDNRLAANWADSDESAKAPWTLIERTGIADLGMTTSLAVPDRVELFIEGPGECLIDEVECRNNGGPNRITNPGFENGAAGWAFQGTHRLSSVENAGAFAGTSCLHLRAVERGDTGANRIRTAVTALTTGGANTATLRARVRWLRGATNILLRIRGQWMECAGGMTVPANLGTPGAPNSRAVANAGPAIYDVAHAPILPAAGEAVRVTARAHDADGLAALTLRYRIDPDTALQEIQMQDNGAGGDAVAGDGVYTATLPGRPAGTLVGFHVLARDANAVQASTTFPDDAPARECLVRFGEALRPATIGSYRLWMTQTNLSFWAARERNSNEGLDATFVYGNWRCVYNAKALYSGSPFHTPTYTGPLGAVCDYQVEFPQDDRLLGSKDFVLNGQDSVFSFFNNDVSAQAESTAYWLGRKLGLGYNHKRHVFVYLNGQARGMIYFDHQQPNTEIVDEYFPDDANGHLHKIEDWFEFDDAGSGQQIITATLQNYVLGGQKRTERYRWNWRPRAGTGPNDFADLFALVDVATAPSPEPLTTAASSLVDVPEWMRHFAFQHAIGDWDTYGYERGKNCYAYKPERGRWRLLLWDLDLVLGAGGQSRGTTDPLFSTAGSEPIISVWYNNPAFVREFWGALLDLVNGPMLEANYGPFVDARYAAFRANNIPVDSPAPMKSWISDRRAFILTQIPAAGFAVTSPATVTTGTNTVLLTGTAPIAAKRILVNGGEYPITWTSATAWTMRVPVGAGTTPLDVSAVSRSGQTLGSATVSVTYTGASPDPSGTVVINEILFDPVRAETGFLELFNTSTNYSFDLSGWRVNGLDYVFRDGAVIGPRSFLVLGRNRGEFAKQFGALVPFYAQYDGALDNNGETLSLLRPGGQPGEELLVDKVKYEARAPWPSNAVGRGSSLQLIDAAQDNARVSNWSDGTGWRFFSLTAVAGGTRLLMYLDAPGTLLIDDISLVAGTVAGVGTNLVMNGDFESPLAPVWKTQGTNATNTAITTSAHLSGNSSLELRFNPAGNPTQYFYQDLSNVVVTGVYTLSFWYQPNSTTTSNLTWRIGSALRATLNVRVAGGAVPVLATPSATNAQTLPLPPYPLVWLNEVLPVNTTGLLDNHGDREPWIELYNSSAAPIALDGFYLSPDFTSLSRWPFPAGAAINPGEFKVVFADGEPNESTATEWHTSFRLEGGTGSVALSRSIGSTPQLVDYLNYDNLDANRSYGSFPDGQLFDRREFYNVTPGGTNNPASAPVVVYINEWMAANNGFIRDPADNDADDWFELYNPGAAAVDLGGFFLTDALTNRFQYAIPDNGHYVIPPRGFLLVWADGEPGQNSTNRPDLHVNFQLRQQGEDIALFAPDGTLIDSVSFTNQTNNISQGHFPEGTGPIVFMTTPTPRGANTGAGPAAPRILGVTVIPGGAVLVTFSSAAGTSYRLEYKDDLGAADWTAVAGSIGGTGGGVTATDATPRGAQRFYRVVVQ